MNDLPRVRELRKQSTAAETAAWWLLRNRQVLGLNSVANARWADLWWISTARKPGWSLSLLAARTHSRAR